jgi:leukotriene-A4 hydrolase
MDYFNGLGDEDLKQKIATINWEERLYTPGLPPKPDFDTSLAEECYNLAAKWKDSVSAIIAARVLSIQLLIYC